MADPLFSVVRSDFDFIPTKGKGNGGQKKNKTSSAIRCVHRASGAVGYAEDDRMQGRNRVTAWQRCTATDTFQRWLKTETARRSGETAAIEAKVDAAMAPENILVEVKDDTGAWVPDSPMSHT